MDATDGERWMKRLSERLDDRMQKHVAFCEHYEREFNHGAPGHLDMLTISRLAASLGDAAELLGAQDRRLEFQPVDTGGLRELLAAYAHDAAWSGWMKYLFESCSTPIDANGGVIIPGWAVERWTRQMNTAYADLPESEKVSDRAEADKMIALIREAVRA